MKMTLSEKLHLIIRILKRLWSFDGTYLVLSLAETVFSALTPYVPIYFSARLIDELSGARDKEMLALYAALTVGLSFLTGLISLALGKLSGYRRRMFDSGESLANAKKAAELDYEKIEERETTLLRERISLESQTGYNIFQVFDQSRSLLSSIVKIITSSALTVSLFMQPNINTGSKLVLIVLVLLAVASALLASRIYLSSMNKFFQKCVSFNAKGNFYGSYFENYNAGKSVRIYGMEQVTLGSFSPLLKKMTGELCAICNRQALVTSVPQLFWYLLQFALYAFIVLSALDGAVTVGSIAKYVSCILISVGAAGQCVGGVQALDNMCKYADHYFEYYDIPTKKHGGTLPVEKRAFCDGGDNEYEIEFRGVSFKYPASESYALKNINMKFRIGERLAVVGMNGSGKTTFIKLLCRLYDPTEGEILLNGIDIRKFDYDEYMSVFSVVFQDFKLFSFSLAQNVASCVDYDGERVKSCLEKAGFGERLSEMPKGIETCLYKDFEEDGVEISGGEAQKIALARALYKDAPFIVLDEPTAALDPVAEAEIYSKFNEIVSDKTAIYISHRLSSCRFCDDIAVFDSGEIVQRGSHDELVADEGGKYHELWNAQAQYYTEK